MPNGEYIQEDGDEEWLTPEGVYINEDQAAVAAVAKLRGLLLSGVGS